MEVMAKQVLDIRAGKGMTTSQSNEFLRNANGGERLKRWSGNYDSTREHLNFEIKKGGVICEVDKKTSVPKRIKMLLLIIDVLSKFLIFIYPYWYAILLQLAWQFLTEIKKSYPFLHFLSPKNASEIQALYSHQIGMQGVDSHKETYEVQETSQENAQQESTEIEQAAVSE